MIAIFSKPVEDVLATTAREHLSQFLRNVTLFVLLAFPSLWLLTHPFPWVSGLESMALGTVIPIFVFGLIGVPKNNAISWFECAAIILCFACLQAYIFNTALHPQNRFNLLGGLLPNADPSMYLSLANQWSSGKRVLTQQTTRQFFPCFLSAMLWLCNRDLKTVVSLFTLITGFVSFLAWRQVRLSFGWPGATLFLALVFFFYRCEVVGLLRTEQLGLWFALISVALLLQGLREKRQTLWNAGLFGLVMGLNTRAGAYLVVPLLVLYSGWVFPRGAWGWRSILSAGLICFMAMLLNLSCYLIFFALPRPTSNFWLCLYGMLTGGNWETALSEIGLSNATNVIAKAKSIALLRAEPWLLAKGFWKACVFAWETNTFYGHPPTSPVFCSSMKWLTVFGAIVPLVGTAIQKKRWELELFVFLTVFGVLISLPFAPPWDGGRRVYAVAFPFLYLAPVALIAWGLRSLAGIARLRSVDDNMFLNRSLSSDPIEHIAHLTHACLGALVFLSTAVPMGLMLSGRYKISGWSPDFCVPVIQGCPARDLPSGYQIHLISDTGRTFVPWVRVSDFRKSISGNLEILRAPWLLDLFNDMRDGTTIGTACHSAFFVIGTDKAETGDISCRHPILNRAWHRVIYDNDYPIPAFSRQLLSQPKAPPLIPAK